MCYLKQVKPIENPSKMMGISVGQLTLPLGCPPRVKPKCKPEPKPNPKAVNLGVPLNRMH